VRGVFGSGSFPGEGVGGHPHLFYTPSGGLIQPGVCGESARRAKEDQAGLKSQVPSRHLPHYQKRSSNPFPPPLPQAYFPSACFLTGNPREPIPPGNLWRRFRIRLPETGS